MFYIRGLVAQLKKKSTKDEVYRAEVWRLPGVLSSGGAGRGGCPLFHPFTVTAHVRYSHPARFPRALVSGDSLQLSRKPSTWLVFTPSSSQRLGEYL